MHPPHNGSILHNTLAFRNVAPVPSLPSDVFSGSCQFAPCCSRPRLRIHSRHTPCYLYPALPSGIHPHRSRGSRLNRPTYCNNSRLCLKYGLEIRDGPLYRGRTTGGSPSPHLCSYGSGPKALLRKGDLTAHMLLWMLLLFIVLCVMSTGWFAPGLWRRAPSEDCDTSLRTVTRP